MADGSNSLPSQSKVLQRSNRLQSSKFAGLIDQHVPAGHRILNAADCTVVAMSQSVLEGLSKPSVYFGAAVQTDRALFVFREGTFGKGKRPWVVDLKDEVKEIGLVNDSDIHKTYVVVDWIQYGSPNRWKLEVGDKSSADLWLVVMEEARQALQSADDAARGARLSIERERLRRLQEGEE